MSPEIVGRAVLHLGDSRVVLAGMPEASVDAVVTDPPYELGFMGKTWDATGVAFDPATWAAVLRVLKPGAHLLAFGGTRTHHRMVCAIEDAGFEIRDEIQWLYGSGFPKSLDVSKAIDKAAGAEREVVGSQPDRWTGKGSVLNFATDRPQSEIPVVGAPATDAARQWEGWGTALKPACEPICLARKPLIGTVAANVLEHGTGALNIDGCRVGTDEIKTMGPRGGNKFSKKMDGGAHLPTETMGTHTGRWPANVLLDEEAARLLDEQSGTLISNGGKGAHRIQSTDAANARRVAYQDYAPTESAVYGDTGGASRFFYVAKPSRDERHIGGEVENTHATVKPIELMEYLIRLVTPPGGTVLDPFLGSGTTGIAALRPARGSELWSFVGIELIPEHFKIAHARIVASTAQGDLLLDGAA